MFWLFINFITLIFLFGVYSDFPLTDNGDLNKADRTQPIWRVQPYEKDADWEIRESSETEWPTIKTDETNLKPRGTNEKPNTQTADQRPKTGGFRNFGRMSFSKLKSPKVQDSKPPKRKCCCRCIRRKNQQQLSRTSQTSDPSRGLSNTLAGDLPRNLPRTDRPGSPPKSPSKIFANSRSGSPLKSQFGASWKQERDYARQALAYRARAAAGALSEEELRRYYQQFHEHIQQHQEHAQQTYGGYYRGGGGLPGYGGHHGHNLGYLRPPKRHHGGGRDDGFLDSSDQSPAGVPLDDPSSIGGLGPDIVVDPAQCCCCIDPDCIQAVGGWCWEFWKIVFKFLWDVVCCGCICDEGICGCCLQIAGTCIENGCCLDACLP